MKRRILLGVAATVAATLLGTTVHAQEQVERIRVGILGGENEADRLTNYACWKSTLETEFGVPVELFPAADYAGVMQGLIADQLDVAGLGASGYAGIYIQDPEAVEVVATTKQLDGSTGYHSVILVRADSGIENLDGLKGKSLAFADPNSTSGYLVPNFQLKEQGIDPAAHFSRTGFGGGHEQAVVALLNDQYDAAATWSSMQGDPAKGYSTGNLFKMVEKGALDMNDVKIIWQSELIPNGPEVIRKDLPADFKQKYTELLMSLPERDPACFQATQGGDFTGFEKVDHSFYDVIVRMRQGETASRRG